MTPQVKSRVRVQDHGEVFTNEREVNAMLDMVKQETHRIDSRFLEPACGNGSFLAEVLSRKLAVVRSRYRRSLFEYEKCAFIAIGSIYGVGILADNTQERRDGLYGIVRISPCARRTQRPKFLDAIRFVIEKNILWGNALSLKAVDRTGVRFERADHLL